MSYIKYIENVVRKSTIKPTIETEAAFFPSEKS